MSGIDARSVAGPGGAERDRLQLLGIGLVLGLGLSPLVFGSPRAAIVGMGAAAGTVGLIAVVALAAERVGDLLFLGLALLVTVPVDKYFGYQAHVGGWPGIRVSAADLIVLLLVPLALLSRFLERGRRAFPAALLVVFALTGLQYGVSTLGSTHRDLSLFEAASAAHAVAFAWVVAILFRRRHLPVVLGALSLQVWVHTLFAFAQAATGRPIGTGIFGGRDEVLTESLTTGASFVRPSGLFMHPIVYADFLLLTLPIVAAGFFAVRHRLAKAGLALTLAFGGAGLALTLSRGAWLSAILAAVVLLALGLRRRLLDWATLRRILTVSGAALLVLLAVLGPRIVDRLTESQAGNLDVRFDLNWIALRMIAASPFAGQGLNTFVEVMARFDPKDVMAYFPAPAHNLYLLEAAEAGIPALLFLLAMFATILGSGIGGLSRARDAGIAWLIAGLVAGLCGLVVSQLADFSLRLEPLRTYVWFLIGLLFGALGCARSAALAAGEPIGRCASAALEGST